MKILIQYSWFNFHIWLFDYFVYFIYILYMYLNFLYVVDCQLKKYQERSFLKDSRYVSKTSISMKIHLLDPILSLFLNQWWESNRIIRGKIFWYIFRNKNTCSYFYFLLKFPDILQYKSKAILSQYIIQFNRFNGKFVNI